MSAQPALIPAGGRSVWHALAREVRRLVIVLLMASAEWARAHDPLDGSIQVLVFDEHLDITVTLGYDAARALLTAMQLSPVDIATLTRARRGRPLQTLPASLSAQVVQLRAGGVPLPVTRFAVLPGDTELEFLVVSQRHANTGTRVTLTAGYYAAVEDMREAPVVVADGVTRRVMTQLTVSPNQPDAAFETISTAVNAPSGTGRFVSLAGH